MERINLHLGCGKRYVPGFIHIDLGSFKHIDIKGNIKNLPMFKDKSVDLIYCCHALEYFDRDEAWEAFKEWRRILKIGGVLRLAVPDFENIVKVYLKHKDLNHQGILGPLYGRMEIRTAASHKIIYHKTVYDFRSLKKTLKSAGFNNIHRYDWRKTMHRDFDDHSQAYIPHMDKERGILISLNVECVR